MKKNWIIIVLTASIAFNLAFIGIFVSFRFLGPKPPNFENRPEISDEMSQRFFDETKVEMRKYSETLRSKKMKFFQELSKENYSEEELKEIVKDIVASQIEMEKYLASRLIKARKNMSDEDAKRFFRNFENHERGDMRRFKRRIDDKDKPPIGEKIRKYKNDN